MSKAESNPRLGALIKKVWRKVAMRNLTATDNHHGLDRLYALPDPWDMASNREQYRFAMTNLVIASKLAQVGTILEIGCGEGHQSRHLAAICKQLYGLDVSARAVSRARHNVPTASFDVGTVTKIPWTPPPARFDLVVACEVLVYMSDPSEAIRRMSELGHACFVSFFGPSARIVAPHIDSLNVERGWFYYDPYAWLWAFWRPDALSPSRIDDSRLAVERRLE